MKSILTSLLALTLTFMLSSCFEFKTEITVNKDGSGTITEEIIIGEQALSMMEMAAQQSEGKTHLFADMQNEEKLKQKATEYGEGVTFVKSEEIKMDDGGKGTRVTYKFSDINKVSLSLDSGVTQLTNMKPGAKSEESSEEVMKAKTSFSYTDGKLTISLPQTEEKASETESNGDGQTFNADDPQTAMVLGLMQGMKISVNIKLAGGIAETNATYYEDDLITLFGIDFDEVMKNPDSLKILNGMNGENPEAFTEALEKLEGNKAETKKTVTATFK